MQEQESAVFPAGLHSGFRVCNGVTRHLCMQGCYVAISIFDGSTGLFPIFFLADSL